MTRETIIPSHNCHDEALYPSSDHFLSIEMDKFLRRYREWSVDQLQVRRGAQDHVSWSLETELTKTQGKGKERRQKLTVKCKRNLVRVIKTENPTQFETKFKLLPSPPHLGAFSFFTSNTIELPAARAQQEADAQLCHPAEPLKSLRSQPNALKPTQRGELLSLHIYTILAHNAWY